MLGPKWVEKNIDTHHERIRAQMKHHSKLNEIHSKETKTTSKIVFGETLER
jgi:hypothetical protein